jgi:hypothetical protein
MTTDTPSSKPWFQKKRYIIAMVLVVLAIIGQFTGSDEPAAPQTLAISDIRDASEYYEDTNEYVWGAYFKINELAPMTKVNCTVKALDAEGNMLEIQAYEGNTLNDKTIIPYGANAVFKTTTKEIVEAISTFDVSCTKK